MVTYPCFVEPSTQRVPTLRPYVWVSLTRPLARAPVYALALVDTGSPVTFFDVPYRRQLNLSPTVLPDDIYRTRGLAPLDPLTGQPAVTEIEIHLFHDITVRFQPVQGDSHGREVVVPTGELIGMANQPGLFRGRTKYAGIIGMNVIRRINLRFHRGDPPTFQID